MVPRIQAGRIFAANPPAARGLAEIDVLHVLAKIILRRFLDAVVPFAEVVVVQIEIEDVVLGEVLLQAPREHHLLELALDLLVAGEHQGFHDLLSDGHRAQSPPAREHIDDGGAEDGEEVHAAVLVEILVLRPRSLPG